MDQKLSHLIDEIMNFMYFEFGPDAQLKIGIWSIEDSPHTYYAILESNDGRVTYGESSYGEDTVEDALKCVVREITEEARGEVSNG